MRRDVAGGSTPSRRIPQRLVTRITSEFLEMPGLTLTAAQASRLLGIQHADCLRLLDALVGAGFLRRSVRGHYVRAGER